MLSQKQLDFVRWASWIEIRLPHLYIEVCYRHPDFYTQEYKTGITLHLIQQPYVRGEIPYRWSFQKLWRTTKEFVEDRR